MTTIVQPAQVRRSRRCPAPLPDSHPALARDGSSLQLRLTRPEDREALEALFARLSRRSVYQRFLTASAVAAHEYVADLADPDRTLDAVLVTWRNEVVAVGSTHRVSASAAEVAFAVDDAHQGQGLGTLMLEDLAARARGRGLHELVALTLASNRQMLRVFADVGLPVHVESAAETCSVTLQLDDQADLAQAAARRAALAAARSMQRFLRPWSVAVLGAGVRRDSVGRQVVEHLRRSGFLGRVYAVNPSGHPVGRTSGFHSIADLPEAVDLAVIAVPDREVTAAVREAVAAGAGAVVVLSPGPSPAGQAPASRSDLRAICRAAGVRLVGPDSIGLVNTDPQVCLDASFLQPTPRPGPVCVVATSWALTASVVAQLDARGIGVSTVVSLGTAGDITAADVLAFAAAEPRTSLVIACLETERDLTGWPASGGSVGHGTLPVLLLTTGQTGPDPTDPTDQEDQDGGPGAGAIRVGSLGELLDTAELLTKAARPVGRRVAVVGNSGAPGRLALEALADHGLLPADLTQHTALRLRMVLPPGASIGQVVDATSTATLEQLRLALMTVAEDPGVDAVVVQISALPHLPACEVAHLLDEVARINPATSIVSAMPDACCRGPQHVPTAGDPDRAVVALAHALEVGPR